MNHVARVSPPFVAVAVAIACAAAFVVAPRAAAPRVAPNPAPTDVAVVAAPQVAPTPACPPLDLDGDGQADRFDEVAESCGTGGCVYRVSLTRGDREVGEIAGHCPFELVARGDGPADVMATWRLGVDEVVTRYRFARGTYRESRDANGACPVVTCP